MIAATAIIHANVQVGLNVVIEDFCIIGATNSACDTALTIIGDNAVIRSHTVIYAGNTIGRNFSTGNKANIREHNEIGDDVSIGTMSVIEHHVSINSGVRIHSQVFIPEYSILHEYCWIGPNVVFTNSKYPQSEGAKSNLKGPTIGRKSRVGANSTILPAVTIGERSIIGAGSVVTKNVAAGAIVYGNPAVYGGQSNY